MFLELQKIIVIRRSELSLHEFYVCRLLDSFMNMPAILISSVGIEYFLPPICASLSMLLSHLTSDTHTLFDLSTCKGNSNTTRDSSSYLYLLFLFYIVELFAFTMRILPLYFL